ncbi:MAGUK p55 subfamily member 6-like [Elysia marginata]|uniref:MAGUK p55 subfamily member 6-like n=1 Tax=Elysia marginata TaxID=1093978 RepID=A0AAV4GK95_9GAST|nr:MAGUK p55 subfamily member 6-like [Elysia marginata]
MPSRKTEKPVTAGEAMENLQDLLAELEDIGATHDELDLLNDVLGAPEYVALGEMYDILTLQLPEPEEEQAAGPLHDTLDMLSSQKQPGPDVEELLDILDNPHIRSLIYTHDDVSRKVYDEVFTDDMLLAAPPPPVFDAVGEQHRFVTIRKNGKEPLGITVRLDDDNVPVIARILQDSLADKQGLLRVGDIVKEVNGIAVFVPEDMMIVLKEAENSITFKIVPSALDQQFSDPVRYCLLRVGDIVKEVNGIAVFVPEDMMIVLKEAENSITFKIVPSALDQQFSDPAKLADMPNAPVGLIPSRTLQEKRNAYVTPELTKTKTSLLCGLKTKRKKKIGYNSAETTDFDKCDIKVYEEVERSNSHRCTLVLVGAQGVGKRSLKERLIRDNPEKFAAAPPHTSRPKKPKEQDGQGYYFISAEKMEAEIKQNMYIDQGEFGGHLYGTRLSTIREVIRAGKICVLDISARSLKFIMSPAFKPFVIFIAAPSIEALKVMHNEKKRMNNNEHRTEVADLFMEERFIRTVKDSKEMEKTYKGLFDEVIVNDDFDNTYHTILEVMEELSRQHKWVPVEWND